MRTTSFRVIVLVVLATVGLLATPAMAGKPRGLRVGDTGPGGGTIYLLTSPTSGYEYAPAGWYNNGDPAHWSSSTPFAADPALTLNWSAATAMAAEFKGSDLTAGKWALPNLVQLQELCKYAKRQPMGDTSVGCVASSKINDKLKSKSGGFVAQCYWSSEPATYPLVWDVCFDAGPVRIADSDPAYALSARPVRAFP